MFNFSKSNIPHGEFRSQYYPCFAVVKTALRDVRPHRCENKGLAPGNRDFGAFFMNCKPRIFLSNMHKKKNSRRMHLRRGRRDIPFVKCGEACTSVQRRDCQNLCLHSTNTQLTTRVQNKSYLLSQHRFVKLIPFYCVAITIVDSKFDNIGIFLALYIYNPLF